MTIPMEVLVWLLGLLGTAIMAGITAILRSLTKQNMTLAQQGSALALLVERVGNTNIEALVMRIAATERRTTDNEADLARIWGIYDAWRGPSSPTVEQRFADRH